MLEFLELLWVRARVFCYESIEFCKVAYRFYPNKLFRQWDLSLLTSYLFVSPFTISKAYLLAKGADDPYLYGETPLTTLSLIAQKCHLNPEDVVYELGCGRGRTCFWLAAFVKCRAVGIEQVPTFVEKANEVKGKYNIKNVRFLEGNYLDYNYKDATVIYLYGTCLEDPTIKLLIKKFARLPRGTKIITVSYPLTDYLDFGQFDLFDLNESFQASFTWGMADLYLHTRR
jgi:SAM-dependent methyltransferase